MTNEEQAFTVKEIVLEIRKDVKDLASFVETQIADVNKNAAVATTKASVVESKIAALAQTVDRIDRGGSIGTKAEAQDHERRLRGLERFRYAFPSVALLSAAASAAAIALHFYH